MQGDASEITHLVNHGTIVDCNCFMVTVTVCDVKSMVFDTIYQAWSGNS